MPDLQHLYFLSDGSYSDSYTGMKLLQESKKKNVAFTEIFTERCNTDSIGRVLMELPSGAMVLINDALVPQSLQVPVLALRDMSYGACTPLGGYFAPISTFATQTAETVFRTLEMGKIDELPYIVVADTAYYACRSALGS